MNAIQAAGIILFIIFYGSYFAKGFMEKKKGISVGRMAVGEKPGGTRVIEIFLLIFTVGIAAVQMISIICYDKWELLLARYHGTIAGGVMNGIGVAAAAAGCTFFLWAMWQMRDNWRAGIDESQNTGLVTEGIYGISRNPAFMGFDLFYIGFGILFSNGLLLLITLLTIFTFHQQIKEEEKYMDRRFGGAYTAYKKRVRRYL